MSVGYAQPSLILVFSVSLEPSILLTRPRFRCPQKLDVTVKPPHVTFGSRLSLEVHDARRRIRERAPSFPQTPPPSDEGIR